MTSPDENEKKAVKAVVGVDIFASTDYALTVPLAGLLADQPELAEQELALEEWRKKLDAYLNSPRPSKG